MLAKNKIYSIREAVIVYRKIKKFLKKYENIIVNNEDRRNRN